MTEKVELQVKARGERPEYFADPAVDKVLSITLALAGEVVVLRERLDTLERLLAAGDPVSGSDIDDYQPDRSVREARDAWREDFFKAVLRCIHQEREELERTAADRASPYDEGIREVLSDG